VTGHHWGPNWKLRASYRAPSLQHTSYLSSVLFCCASSIFHHWVWYRPLSLCIFDVRASSSPHRLPLCEISFLSQPRCWASPQRKIVYSITQSLTQSLTHPAYLMPREPKLLLRKNLTKIWSSWGSGFWYTDSVCPRSFRDRNIKRSHYHQCMSHQFCFSIINECVQLETKCIAMTAMQNWQELSVPTSFLRPDDCAYISTGCPKNTQICSTLPNLTIISA